MKNSIFTLFLFISGVISAQVLVNAEYFFDMDPGFGNGTPISISLNDSIDMAVSLSTSTLTVGTHQLYMRTQDADGKWSLCDRSSVIISPDPGNLPSITAAEYFWDTDPGFGAGVPLTIAPDDSIDMNLSIPTTGLAEGTHQLKIRVQDNAGLWSMYDAQSIEIINDVGIDEHIREVSLNAYPTFSDGPVRLELQGKFESNASLTLYDAIGRPVKSFARDLNGISMSSYQVDISKLPAGIYFFALETSDFRVTTQVVRR